MKFKLKARKFSKTTVSILLCLIMLVSMLTVGLISANAAYSIANGTKLYFINSGDWDNVNLYYWGSNWNNVAALSQISNTDIYYLSFSSQWDSLTGVLFKETCDTLTFTNQTSDIYSNLSGNVAYDASTTQITDMTKLNGTAYVKVKVDTGDGSYDTEANSSCIATISSNNLTTGSTSTTASSGSTDGTTYTAKCYPAYGATVTYTAEASGNYEFKGFSTTNSTSLPSDVSTGTYTRTSDAYNGSSNLSNVYAYFQYTEDTYNVTVSAGTGGKISVDSGTSTSSTTVNVGTSTTAEVEAIPDDGYEFDSWSVTGDTATGVSDGDTTNPITALGATGSGNTVTAKFTEKATQNVTISSPTNGSVTVSGSSVSGNSPKTVASGESDSTFTAHVDDKLTITTTPSSGYKLASLTVNGTVISSGDTYTVVSGTDVTVTATFEETTSYRVKVYGGVGGTTTVETKLYGESSTSTTTIDEGTAQNFDIDWESSYTVTFTASDGYEVSTSTITLDGSTSDISTGYEGENSDDGAVITIKYTASWPPSDITVGSDTSNQILYIDATGNNSFYSAYDSETLSSITAYYNSSGDYYWADLTDLISSKTNNIYFSLANSSNSIWRSSTSTVDVTNADGVSAGTTDYSSVYFAGIWSIDSSVTKLGVKVVDNGTYFEYYFYTSTSSSSSDPSYDPFYIGGRFVTDSAYTGDYAGDFDIDSTAIEFTEGSDNIWSLDTGKTIAELSEELYNRGQTSTNPQYFIIHDTVNNYAIAAGDYSGLTFHNNDSSSNPLTLNPVTSPAIVNELMFDDPDNTSNGTVVIYIDASDYAEGNSASALKVWYDVENETPAVADTLTFSASPTSTTVNKTITLTATISDVNSSIDDPATELQFVFYDVTNDKTVATVTGTSITNPSTGKYRATTTVTSTTVTTNTYKVTVSTTDSYDGGTELREVYKTATGTWTAATVYYTSDITSSTSSPTWTAIDTTTQLATIDTTLSAGSSYTISLSDEGEYNPDFDDYTIGTCKYCTITKSNATVTIDDEDRTVRTYVITPLTNCSDPVITINSSTGIISAVATYDKYTDDENTFDQTKYVKYYFAKNVTTDKGGTNYLDGNSGIHIRYYNNSVTSKSGDAWAVPVKADGTTSSGSYSATSSQYTGDDSNATDYQIIIDESQLYRYTSDASAKTSTSAYTTYYNVYVLEIPIWATSADLVGSNGSDMLTTDILSLNPNRIYVFWTTGDSDKQWSGVPLDTSFWYSENSSTMIRGTTGYENNQVPTKNFSTNLIKYATTGADYSGTVNTQLSSEYSTRGITTALYWGMFANSTSQSFTNWDIALNLAQRNNDQSYYASIWNIVDPFLTEDTAGMNPLGGGLLTAYDDDSVMPFFDYDYLEGDSSAADGVFTDVDFPFYSSEFDGVTTYSYDSATDLNRLFSTSDETYSLATPHMEGDNLGYLPFYGSSYSDPNLAFANEFDIDFYMTTTGTLQGTNETHDINFNFSGDDDVWVFVDGVLVLDLGGDHKISAGSINFTDMKVYYKSTATDFAEDMGTAGTWATDADYVYTMDLQSILDAHGVTFKNTDATTKHTLQMFYMERGRGESNMSLSFNLPQASGLNIRNTVTADNVNAGLQDAALKASNPDYFAYTVANASATDTAITSLSTVSGYENALLPSSTSDWSAVSSTPIFPYKYDVNRVFEGVTYVLGSASDTRTSAAHSVLSSISSEFQLLLDNAFVLSDVYATTDDTSAKLSGVTDDSSGEFYLLGGQMANFTDKVSPNSYVQVLQKKDLGEAVANTDNNDIIGYSAVSDNNSGNYYLTSYSIYDEAAAKYIVEKTDYGVDVSDTDTYYATDESASLTSGGSTNGFYFTNYADDSTNVNPAMTVDFYNDIAVGSLKVSKEITNSTSASDNFYFKVEFCQMFGDTDDSDWTEYSGLEYQIYNSEDDTLVSTATYSYGTSGIVIQPGQYALIEGIPVETRFNVTEVARAGYSLVDIDKTCTKPDGSAVDYTVKGITDGLYTYEDQGSSSLSLLDKTYTDSDGYIYYCNMVPTVEETLVSDNNYISISTAAYQNKKDNFTIVFKYFDRYEEDGETAGINSSATTCSISYDSIPTDYIEYNTSGDESSGVKSIDFATMIGTEGTAFVNSISNVMCSYNCWTSQSAAVTAMAGLQYYNDGTLTSYDEAAYPYHTNYLAQPNTSGEKWVTYYNSKGTEVDEPTSSSSGSDYLAVRQIIVWCRNYPKTYNVDVYGADDYSDLTSITVGSDTLYIANASETSVSKTDNTFYFNQRLGYSYNEAQDAAGFIENYGISGIYTDSSGNNLLPENYATESFTNDSSTYYFAYWAYDAAGTQIASTDRSFMYRVCDDTKLYAVYSTTEDYGSVGISLSALDNDTYVDSNGTEYTRLNILASVVNADPGDENIQKLAFVRVALSPQIRSDSATYTPAKISELMDTYKDQFKALLTQYDATFSESHTYTGVTLTLTTKGYVYTVADSITDTSSIVLSNKNRAQFTTSFKTSVLNNSENPTCLAYTGAVKYNGEWIMSNNSLIYYNGTVKDNTATSWD